MIRKDQLKRKTDGSSVRPLYTQKWWCFLCPPPNVKSHPFLSVPLFSHRLQSQDEKSRVRLEVGTCTNFRPHVVVAVGKKPLIQPLPRAASELILALVSGKKDRTKTFSFSFLQNWCPQDYRHMTTKTSHQKSWESCKGKNKRNETKRQIKTIVPDHKNASVIAQNRMSV